MCVGKALTGGYLTLAATLCTPRVAASIRAAPRADARADVHGQSARLCGGAGVDRLLRSRGWKATSPIGPGFEPAWRRSRASRCPRRARDRRDRRRQLDGPVERAAACRRDAGAWLRPFRDLLYTMPPFISTTADIATITEAVRAAVKASVA